MKGKWQNKVSGWDRKGVRRKKHNSKHTKRDNAKRIRRKQYEDSDIATGFISGRRSMKDWKRFFRAAERQKTKEAITHENYDATLDGRNRKANQGALSGKPAYYRVD